ncbi:hypothetical protein PR048_020337 [Dryococelus australis]|uniref:Retrovirus-related Pol polyprotein from transposon TNT 1-94-like beta-barrel domain-containing protein n=1 Tax=Dryococelus australis TaxID=614101 RepID=A0ABQ9H615_9NEOP|nr:hypothetical protein PR048_020337 [Dryococelus australis]
MTLKKDWLIDFQGDSHIKVTVANAESVLSEGVSNVEVKTLYRNKVIQDTVLVPGIKTNLLSVSKIAEKGHCVVFNERNCTIYSDDNIVATATKMKDLYVLNTCQESVYMSKGQSTNRYSEIVEEIKAARDKRKNGILLLAKDCRHLKRFDVIYFGNNEKLINAIEESNSEIKYYCRVGEMFDIIECAHHKLGHKKEKAMEVELKRNYANITREVINAYLNLCEPYTLKKKAKGK